MSGAIHPLSATEVAATAAIRWRRQYRDWQPGDKFADGTTKQSIDDALNAAAHTPANIEAALSKGWAYPQCSCCDGYFENVAEFRNEWKDESDYRLCLSCLKRAALMLGCTDVDA